MAGPYEDPMGGQMPANPGGGGLPGQPRNPATGGYPSRDIAPSPLQPGQMANPDLYARSRQNQQWQDMMRRQRFGGMVGGPGMWGGGMPMPRGPVDPGFNIGGTPYVAPTFDSPDAAGNPAQKAADIARYKAGIRGSAGQTASAMNGGGMTDAYHDTRAPDWMDPTRAAQMQARVSNRVMRDAMPDMGRPDPNMPRRGSDGMVESPWQDDTGTWHGPGSGVSKYPGGMPGPIDAPRGPGIPPWFGGPTGGLFGPPQWGGGGATPPGGAKPGGPGGQMQPGQLAPNLDYSTRYAQRQQTGAPPQSAQAPQPAQSGAQPEPGVYPA